jgi:hypothetical protein
MLESEKGKGWMGGGWVITALTKRKIDFNKPDLTHFFHQRIPQSKENK